MIRSIIALVVLISLVSASGPRLITSRTILNHELIVGRETVVNIEIFNVGDETAFNIEYQELANLENFDIVLGPQSATWSKLSPGGKISHNYVVKPNTEGVFVVGEASISYRSQASIAPQVVRTTDKLERPVIKFSEYERVVGANLGTWIVFTALAGVPIGLALFRWVNYRVSFVDGVSKSSAIYKAKGSQELQKKKKK